MCEIHVCSNSTNDCVLNYLLINLDCFKAGLSVVCVPQGSIAPTFLFRYKFGVVGRALDVHNIMSAEEQEANVQPQIANVFMPWFMGAPWVPKFSGEGESCRFIEWRTQIEALIRAQGLNSQQRVDFVLSALEGNAKREVALLTSEQRNTDTTILQALSQLYGSQQPIAQLRIQFFKCKQEPGEDVRAFTLRLRELHHKWRAREPLIAGTDDELLRTQFIMGLRPGTTNQELQRLLRRTPTLTFTEACEEAKALEQEQGQAEATQVCPIFTSTSKTAAAKAPVIDGWQQMKEALRAELREELREQVTLLGKSIVDELQGRLNISPLAPSPPTAAPQTSVVPTSTRPSWSPQPNAPRRQRLGSAPPAQSFYQWDAQGRAICRDCGEAGHIQRFCPRRRPTQTGFRYPRPPQGE